MTHALSSQLRVTRLIEVDLPIRRISTQAAREKSIRHGHISTLHIWWARRPLAACRAVICAALWPDPADQHCPQAFRDTAAKLLIGFAKRVNPERISEEKRQLQDSLSVESRARWEVFAKNNPPFDPKDPSHQNILRFALLDFIADFANWDNSTIPAYLETSRALTQAAHESLGGAPNTRPLVVDPFAGGGSIPLEALRVGADAFASDLNPIAVLLNKVVLEYIPKYGKQLANEVRKWGQWVKGQTERELAEFYPKGQHPAPPIAYLWARTIRCEGAGCGAEVPLIRSLWLAKKGNKSVGLKLIPNTSDKRLHFEIINDAKAKDIGEGTVKRGSATCPCCGYTTPVKSVRSQLVAAHGGADTSRLLAVVLRDSTEKTYRLPTNADEEVVRSLREQHRREDLIDPLPLPLMSGVFNAPIYGITRWDLLFSLRQLLTARALQKTVKSLNDTLQAGPDKGLRTAVVVVLHLALGKYLDFRSTLCAWITVGEKIGHTFGRQALGMIFDWVEGTPFGDMSGSWERSYEYIAEFIEHEAVSACRAGTVERSPAQRHLMPDDVAQLYCTDPPYYNAVPYADLSDFFYPWFKASLAESHPSLFSTPLAPKEDEICEMSGWDPVRYPHKDAAFYEREMRAAFAEGHRICSHNGIGVVVFAHKSTVGWETLLSALIESKWVVTGSWPIDTERGGRLRAMGSAALASSVHLVCRPRTCNEVGDWRDVLSELPARMHEWMPRLASEGVVGADAIFACLGPALEIFSRYSRVEKANGAPVALKEYLEHVWAAVSKEALSTIFRDADASGLEPEARLTAMWLWTLGGGAPTTNGKPVDDANVGEEDTEDQEEGRGATTSGFTLEYDAARKIAQGLGIDLERSEAIVEVTGAKARLLAVAERVKHLFGKDSEAGPAARKKSKKTVRQASLFDDLEVAEETEAGSQELNGLPPGATILDRLHQAMILFGAQRGELLKRFLVEEGVGKDARFWKLAQSLAALYPQGTDERRWVEGVLARKKGLGL
ncbi:MAG: DUF1156 domain-containing protein [Gemmataceae bacterium]